MVSRHLYLFHLAVTLVLTIQPAWPQRSAESATITGHVVDSENRPVEGATISIFPMEMGISGKLPTAITDLDGRYKLVSQPFGKTRFSAAKESAGYPDTQGLLFSSGKENMPEEYLTPGAHLVVDIHLGAPDGILEGSVIDAKTHVAVSKARITLHRDESESMYSGTLPINGDFRFRIAALYLFPSPLPHPVTCSGNTKYRPPRQTRLP